MATGTKIHHLDFWLAALGILAITVLLWAPFGLKRTDLAEGWFMMPWVGKRSLVEIVQAPHQPSRPLSSLPWKVGSLIDSGSFVGVGLVLASLLFGKTTVFYATLRRLRLAPPALAFLIAVLFMLYPADNGNLTMRAMGRQTGVFFFLLAQLFLILAAKTNRAKYIVAMVLSAGVSGLIAEQGYILMLCAPALLAITEGASRKTKVLIAGSWYATLFLTVLNFVLAQKAYQSKLLQAGMMSSPGEYVQEILRSNLLALKWVYLDCWPHAVRVFRDLDARHMFFAVLICAVTAVVVYLLNRYGGSSGGTVTTSRGLILIILVGLLVVGSTFFPYSLTGHRYVRFRVFYYAAAGAALVIGVLLEFLVRKVFRRRAVVSALLWAGMIAVISGNALAQHERDVQISRLQQAVLVQIVEQAPWVKKRTQVVLLAGRREPGRFTKTGPAMIRFALSWVYGYRVEARACAQMNEDCLARLAVERAMVFRVTEEGRTVLLERLPKAFAKAGLSSDAYQPYRRIERYTPFPERVRRMFDVVPVAAHVAPRGWEGKRQSLEDRRVCDAKVSGSCALRLDKGSEGARFAQFVAVGGRGGDDLAVVLWSRGEKAVSEAIRIGSVTVRYSDGTEERREIVAGIGEQWSEKKLALRTARAYTGVLVELQSAPGVTSIWFDDVSVLQNNVAVEVENGSFEV